MNLRPFMCGFFVKDLQEFVLMIDVYEQIVAITRTQRRTGAGKVAGCTLRFSVVKWKLKRETAITISPHDSQCTLNARIARNCVETSTSCTSSTPYRFSHPRSISACGVVGGSDKKSQLAFIELCNSLKDYSSNCCQFSRRLFGFY